MKPDFEKYKDGLVPTIIQDADTKMVLMLGFMNEEALEKTRKESKVTFFSRSKQHLWTKGETSGNHLIVKEILMDCDKDTLLIKASPEGPVCHTGADTCFNEKNESGSFLNQLEDIIDERKTHRVPGSYTASLFEKGINAIAQKLGEEAVELIIESKDQDADKFRNEAADLMFHFLVLLKAKGFSLAEVTAVLKERHKETK
jgi:phosphoribosyl-ATP pyrophosphohydrolase/phosphoribosyl-AMP cyclohydrolase